MNSDEIDEVYSDYLFWRHEGLNPLATAESYASLLLDNRLGELSEKQREWLNVVLRNSREARKRWDDFGEFLRARHALQKNTDAPRFLAEAIQHSLSWNLKQYKYRSAPEIVEVEILPSLQLEKISPEFESVFFYLLAPAFKLLNENNIDKTTLKIKASPHSADVITIQLRGMVPYFHGASNGSGNFPYPNVEINLAYYILKQKGIALQAEIISGELENITTVDFVFDLPVWNDLAA